MERPKLKTLELEEVTRPIEKLAAQLTEPILNRRYSLIVGDDYSGRLPTLILGRAINYAYREQGEESVPTVFVKVSSPFWRGDRAPFERFRQRGRALVITEAVHLGLAIGDIGASLRYYQLMFDVAAVTTKRDPKSYCVDWPHQTPKSTTVFAGKFGSDDSPLLHQMELTGLKKEVLGVVVDYKHRELYLQAMRDVQVMARYLADRYFIP